MAYAQWVTITLQPLNFALSLANVQLKWGKFHEYGNKDKEISINQIKNIIVRPGERAIISSCGREHDPSGTEGSFDIMNYDLKVKVGNYYWDCPWGSKKNTSTWSPNLQVNYLTEVAGANLDSGALGNVTIKSLNLSSFSRKDEYFETAGSPAHVDGVISVVRRNLIDELQGTVDALENGLSELSLSEESRR